MEAALQKCSQEYRFYNAKYKTSLTCGEKVIIVSRSLYDQFKVYIAYARPIITDDKFRSNKLRYIFTSSANDDKKKNFFNQMNHSLVSKCLTRCFKKAQVFKKNTYKMYCLVEFVSLLLQSSSCSAKLLQTISPTASQSTVHKLAKNFMCSFSRIKRLHVCHRSHCRCLLTLLKKRKKQLRDKGKKTLQNIYSVIGKDKILVQRHP